MPLLYHDFSRGAVIEDECNEAKPHARSGEGSQADLLRRPSIESDSKSGRTNRSDERPYCTGDSGVHLGLQSDSKAQTCKVWCL